MTKLVPTLDTTASDLVSHQKDALVERKELAQKTKDFRRLEDAAKLTEIKGLLKAYQGYIDLISNQSKTVHNSFLHVYSLLSEAPDPYPLLEASVDSLVTAEETVPKLENENKHLQTTVSKLSSQLDDTERRLRDETNLRQKVQEQRDEKVKEVETSWSAVLSEKEDNWAAKEKSLEERADNQERLLKELKASFEVSQRLDKNTDDDSANLNNVSTAELELLSSDLERANQRLAEVEGRNEQLRLDLAQQATSGGAKSQSTNVEEDPAFVRLRSENTTLMRRMDAVQYERDADKRDFDANIRGLKREAAGLVEDRNALNSKVQKLADYDEIKSELAILRSIEFATGDDEDDENERKPETDGDGAGKDSGQALEKMLMNRNKKLNNELTLLRVSQRELESQHDVVREDLSRSNAELEQSKNLVSTLENDLTRLQQGAVTPGPAMSVAGTYVSKHPGSSFPRRGRVSPTSSIISGLESNRAINSGEQYGGGSGMLPMITAQRDRFKKRITELEADNNKAYQNVNSLRSEVAALQKDNLNLYEKTRYVSSYARTQPASEPSLNPNPSTVAIGDAAAPLDRYKSAYESRISPFAAFRGHESMRALKRMSLPERAFLQTTKVVLRDRLSRNVFALYLLALHIVIVSMLYAQAGTTSPSIGHQNSKTVFKETNDG